jgi:hypothetical protein
MMSWMVLLLVLTFGLAVEMIYVSQNVRMDLAVQKHGDNFGWDGIPGVSSPLHSTHSKGVLSTEQPSLSAKKGFFSRYSNQCPQHKRREHRPKNKNELHSTNHGTVRNDGKNRQDHKISSPTTSTNS